MTKTGRISSRSAIEEACRAGHSIAVPPISWSTNFLHRAVASQALAQKQRSMVHQSSGRGSAAKAGMIWSKSSTPRPNRRYGGRLVLALVVFVTGVVRIDQVEMVDAAVEHADQLQRPARQGLFPARLAPRPRPPSGRGRCPAARRSWVCPPHPTRGRSRKAC